MASEEGGGADSVKETQRSRVYSQFIKELSVQYKPALNELQTMIGGDSSEEDSSEDGEMEGEKEEPVITYNGSNIYLFIYLFVCLFVCFCFQ